MAFFDSLRHLLPQSSLWSLPVGSTIRKFIEGLTGTFDDAKTYADEVYDDQWSATTRELHTWENEHGLRHTGTTEARRVALAAERQLIGGQDPTYIQDRLHAAGFDTLYVHDWWSSTHPYVARDPRDYTQQPQVGTAQCTGYDTEDEPLEGQPQCTDGLDDSEDAVYQYQCNDFGVNPIGYLVNKDLSGRAPPPVPDDPAYWPYFLYIGSETFGDFVTIDLDRRDVLERLLLKICPAHLWIVLMLESDPDSYFTFDTGGGWDVTRWKHFE